MVKEGFSKESGTLRVRRPVLSKSGSYPRQGAHRGPERETRMPFLKPSKKASEGEIQ